MFIYVIIIDAKISLLLLKICILWSSTTSVIRAKSNTQNGCHVQRHKYLFFLLARFLKPTLFQIQQLDVFYHLFLICVLGICWHKCLTNTDIVFHSNGTARGIPRKFPFCQVGHRVLEEVPKATKNVGKVCSWADREKQEKAPESTLKMLWNSPFKLVRAMPEPLRTWLHMKVSPGKPAIRFLWAIQQSTQTHVRMWEQQSSSKVLRVTRNVWIQPAAILAPGIFLSPNAWVCGHWGQEAMAHTRD